MIQAFQNFFNLFNIPFATPIIAACIILGGFSAVSAWIIGPTKGILVASEDNVLPVIFSKTNKHGVPVGALIVQACIVTALSLAFVLMPSINGSFALLSIITAQLALIVYILFFAAAIKLHHAKPHIERHFKVPGGSTGIWIVALCGMLLCFIAIGVGFIPPVQIKIHSILLYEVLLVCGMGLLAATPFFIQHIATLTRRKK